MAMKRIFGPRAERKELSESEEEMLDGLAANMAGKQAARRKEVKRPAPTAKSAPATAARAPKTTTPSDPWRELEGELSRRIEEKGPRMSVGTRLAERARARTGPVLRATAPAAPRAIARQEVADLKEISAELDQKILESGLHKLPSVEKNVYRVLGIDVDEAELPRDAEQLLILSVRLMRAAKGFTLNKKIREALFCYEKSVVLFDRILDQDPDRTVTRDMKQLVQRFITILSKRV